MTKPDDIPQDVWDSAVNVTIGTMAFGSPRVTVAIARAILSERERCAKIADNNSVDNPFPTMGRAIGRTIRRGK